MCRLGVCPNWLWSLDVFSLSTPTAIIHSCRTPPTKNPTPGTKPRATDAPMNQNARRNTH
eukprot:scaffold14454_cov122-Isochrysis_galbana.AAC.1